MPAPSWISDDAELVPWEHVLGEWNAQFQATVRQITDTEGSLHEFCFANGLHRFGLQRDDEHAGWWYREWAPAALGVSIVGDFNDWDPTRHSCKRGSDGVFEVFLPDEAQPGRPAVPLLRPGDRYKAAMRVAATPASYSRCEKLPPLFELRVPAWAKQTVQDALTGDFFAVVPDRQLPFFSWLHPRPPLP